MEKAKGRMKKAKRSWERVVGAKARAGQQAILTKYKKYIRNRDEVNTLVAGAKRKRMRELRP